MMWGGVAASCYRRMKPRLCLCERREKMVRKVGENVAVFCPIFSWVSLDFFVDFAQ